MYVFILFKYPQVLVFCFDGLFILTQYFPHIFSDNFHTRLSNGDEEERRRREMTEVTDLMRNITSCKSVNSDV